MANRNSGAWQRSSNGVSILLGSDPLLNLVPGSLRYKLMQRQRIDNYDRGVHGSTTIGDQRNQEVEFQLYRTSTFETLRALLVPAGTNGAETGFSMTIKQPDYLGAATGETFTLTAGYLPDGFEDIADSGGQDVDKITIRAVFRCDYPTISTY